MANENQTKEVASSISSIFGTTNSSIDESVSNLFSSNAGPVSRVLKQRTVVNVPQRETAPSEETGTEETSENASEETEDVEMEEAQPNKRKRNEDNEDLESKYFDKLLNEDTKKEDEQTEQPESAQKSVDQPDKIVKGKSAKELDLKEKELLKAEATVFVGNVTSKVITDKKQYKEFKALFAKFGTIDSIRFRSISFDDALPRKVAFLQQKFHDARDTVNSYIVYKKKEDSLKAVELNSTVFLETHLRVDHVAHPSKQDNKRTIFVGNLDFEEKEESLWSYFEKTGEVDYVRIIRDSKTNVGKGFAYVQFQDSLSVSKALMLNDKPLTTSEKKRKLRITRCKNIKPQRQTNVKNGQQVKLTDQQRTKLGRAKKILGKADRFSAGKVIEGTRATKGDRVAGIKNGLGKVKKPRTKKPRIRERSTKFRKERDTMAKELKN